MSAQSQPSRRHYDVAIVGGGIVGLYLARILATAGMAVLVLDRRAPGAAGSAINAGTLALQNKRPPLLPFYREALAEWRRLADDLGIETIGYGSHGGFHVATSEAEVGALRSVAEAHARAGIATEWLEGTALRRRAPWLGDTVRAATQAAADAYANPLLALPALARAAREAGAEIVGDAPLHRALRDERGFRLVTESHSVGCRIVVIAAGPWSGGIGAHFGFNLPVRSSVIVLSVCEPAPPFMDAIVTHVGGRLTVKQLANGTTLIGGGWPGRGALASDEDSIDVAALRHNLAFAASVVPRLPHLRLVRCWAGYETETPDSLPVAGPLDGERRVFAAVPAAAGFTAGPYLARCVAETILTGTMPELARALDPARFGPAPLSRT